MAVLRDAPSVASTDAFAVVFGSLLMLLLLLFSFNFSFLNLGKK